MMFDTLAGSPGPLAGDALPLLLDAALKSSLLLVVAAGVTVALRERSAAQRHLVWSVAIVAALAMPLLARMVPRIELPVALPALQTSADGGSGEAGPAHLIADARERAEADDAEAGDAGDAGRAGSNRGAPLSGADEGAGTARTADPADPGPATSRDEREAAIERRERLYRALGIGGDDVRAAERLRTDWLETRTRALDARTGIFGRRLDDLETRVSALEDAASAAPGVLRPPERERRAETGVALAGADGPVAGSAASAAPDPRTTLPGIALTVWLTGVALVLGALVVGALRLRLIARRSTPIRSGRLARAAARIATRLRLARVPAILEGDEASIPMTWGLVRPVVLLPPGAADWQTWRLEAVLLHELGHVQRRDYLSQMAAHVACALYWFNPLVWIAAHRMRVEREHACDDLVVASGGEAARYAHDLLALARSFRSRGRVDAVALGMARPDHLRERLVAVMDPGRSRHPLTRARAWGAGSLGLAAAAGLAALAPATPAEARTPPPAVADGAGPTAAEAPAAERVFDPAVEPELRTLDPALPGVRSPLRELLGALGDALTPGALPTPAVRPFRSVQEAAALCGPADGESHSHSSMTNDDVRIIETEYGSCRSSIRIEGDLEFSDDFTALTHMSSDAFLRMEVTRDGTRRRLEARPGAGGRPEYTWSVDGRNRPFDGDAERWMESALLDLFRTSGYMARERAAWILSQEGPDGVLAEVERMTADHAQARYLAVLLERGGLSPAQVRGVIEVAGREIDSDHSLGEVLRTTAATYALDGPARAAFLDAARSLESDHQQGEVFRTALARGDLSRENLSVLLEAAASGIESDHQLGEILMELGARYPLEPSLRDPFLRAASTIESDHQKGRVYGFVLQQEGLRPPEMAAVLEAARGIESDHTLAQLLIEVAGRGLADPALRRAFLTAAATIESDHNRSEVYRAALALDLTDEELASILTASADIGSHHQLSSLLTEVSSRMTTPTLQRAYLDAASRIESDHNLGQALSPLVGLDSLGEAEQIRLLATARQIDSDHTLSEVLIRFARTRPVSGDVRTAFLRALDGIESEHQHGRVASVLVDRGGE